MYDTYVAWLIAVNEDGIKNNPNFLASCCLGLIEEITEFSHANTGAELIKEAGDIIAYGILTVETIRRHIGCNTTAFSFVDSLKFPFLANNPRSSLQIVGELAASYKRLMRGDDDAVDEAINLTFVLVNLVLTEEFYVSETKSNFPMLIKEITEVNYTKLTNRLERQGTFKGKGDNR